MSSSKIFVKTHVPGLDEVISGFPEGGLVLVTGKPGAGKTIMAMTFIYRGALEAGERGVYVSVYESRERFLQLAGRLGMDFEKLEEKGLFSHVWIPVTMEAGAVTSINMILERVETVGAKRLVIDSFSALRQQFRDPGEARIFLQTLLSKIIERLGCTTLLIKEGEPLTGQLDFEEYVADAVLHLEKDYFEGRVMRRLEILKLRGTDLVFPQLVCTISNGLKVMLSARTLSLVKPTQQVAPESWVPSDPSGAYTTGIPDLDREIGGYPHGSTVLIEIDPKLTYPEYIMSFVPTIASFVLKGRHAIVIPSGGITPDLIKEINSYYGVTNQIFRERYHIFYEKDEELAKELNVHRFEPKDAEATGRIIAQYASRLIEKTGSPVIGVMGSIDLSS